ncbi:hypothetical protein SAMN04244553_2375 [Nocardia amikacinitolerans]|uniref:ABM domain-containing protein n=1 Tax=Nocardia amikacinitolerans TaxID=756689 RepID=A0A285L8L2_9NOCA|nr:hypothetical protein [Nocardia amikacinitolerans]MCP2275016.1 hypothetical protein [Nocardia amikacinitolerans]MCP2296244.1 hypothetical protein [Nocardia amikacinitolerans]MCP2316322.1 hypothetical protein [Nocardia amikacinitolerans]SNY80803.1 hypothetical protein SAMN04244553_2375 [Nocardia amikacinitolerans]
MFIQVIQGKVSDVDRLRRCMDRWTTELEPGAVGYLGTTYGLSDDGTFIALARFESEEAARRNSARPEQGAWWAETERCFEGPVTFMDCPEVTQWMGGGSDEAGFVQIMEGHTSDARRMRELLAQTGDRVHELRPEILGGTLSTYGADGYVEAVYFRSEAEAREHEKIEIPDDLRPLFEEERRLMGDVTYFDLHEPMLLSARK